MRGPKTQNIYLPSLKNHDSETQIMAKQVLLSLFVILLAVSSIVRAQQSQSQTSSIDQKQTTRKDDDKQPSPNLLKDDGDMQDPKLAVYQVHRLAEKILALRSVRAKAVEIARLASVLWNQDEPHARVLFQKALNMLTIASGSDPEPWVISALHHRVIALIARRDAEWAKRLIDFAAKREGEDKSSKNAGYANLRTALGLLQEDAPVAIQFAERSLKAGVPWGFLDFVLRLRKNDEPEANRLFLQALNSLSQQPAVDIREFHSLGLYLFTAPDMIDSDYHKITLVDQILVPNITADRPGVPTVLVRAYLGTAADILWRISSDSEQRKYSYALCYMLLPKSKNVAPDLTAKLDAVMARLTPEVPTGLTKDSAFRYMNMAPTSVEEKLTNAENQPDQQSRDMAYLEIAFQAWRKGDFKTARIAQGRIAELEASQRLATIIDFGDGAWTIKQNAADLSKAEAVANRLPQGI